MKKKIIYIPVLIVCITIFTKCSEAIIDEGNVTISQEVKYNNDVKTIMTNYCITCHGNITPSAGLNLSTYQNVRFSIENGNLINRINSTTSPMPQNGLMSLENRLKIQKWANDGFPEN